MCCSTIEIKGVFLAYLDLPIFAHSLKIGLIEAGLLLPQGNVNLGDLVIARSYPS